MTTASDHPPTLGLLLAGGAATRMGGRDKRGLEIAGRTLIDRVIARLAPQCDGLVLNSNEDPANLPQSSLPCVADSIKGRAGPLAGLLAGLDWIETNRIGMGWMLSTSIDCPFLPLDLVSRLHQARRATDTPIAIATSRGRTHYVVALWHTSLRADLRNALDQGVRKVRNFAGQHRTALAEWPSGPVDPFFNINTPADLAEAQRLAVIADR